MTEEPLTFPAAPEDSSHKEARQFAIMLNSKVFWVWYKYRETPEDQEYFFTVLLNLGSKEEYLAFRDTLKQWLRDLAVTQKRLKKNMRQPGGCPSSQSDASERAHFITTMIDMRRGGKIWSARQMEKARNRAA